MNLSLSPFGFRPLSRSASLNEISLLISEFNCPAPLECHNIHFSVFLLLYIPQLSLMYLASLIFNLIFIKFILMAEMEFFIKRTGSSFPVGLKKSKNHAVNWLWRGPHGMDLRAVSKSWVRSPVKSQKESGDLSPTTVSNWILLTNQMSLK